LEGYAFQAAQMRFMCNVRVRKGAAFPHSKRRSRQ
jgi:hypothetical protein